MYLSLDELCRTISISTATGRNWMKLHKIEPQIQKDGFPFFTREYVEQLKVNIATGLNTALKSRRNKKYISGNSLYLDYVEKGSQNVESVQKITTYLTETQISCEEAEWKILLAECAMQLLCMRNGTITSIDSLQNYLLGKTKLEQFQPLLEDLLEEKEKTLEFIENNPKLFAIKYKFVEGEDTLGLLYSSVRNLTNRKATGAYYTPTKVVKSLIDELQIDEQMGQKNSFFDPCCGTGNFLLQLPLVVPLENIYGNDLDEISVIITRINMALKYQPKDIELLYTQITCSDFFKETTENKYNCILGNPPWGYSFTQEEKRWFLEHFKVADSKKVESYDLFLEKSLTCLQKNGIMSYVIPEAFLSVKAHLKSRTLIWENGSIEFINYLGNVFDKVMCPSIIMQFCYTGQRMQCKGMKIQDGKKIFYLKENRIVTPESFSFKITDQEQKIINKILNQSNCVTLKGKADFALGIVTGNNKTYISKQKAIHAERILKGTDIYKFRIKPSDHYIIFQPDKMQQVAPERYYRAEEKLLYRFIGNQLVFAYDKEKTLSLNSCNILIPQIEGLQMQYIMAVLNSGVAQFIYSKLFQSVKILKSHIEKIPIPFASEREQMEIIEMVNQLTVKEEIEEIKTLYEKLDQKIANLYHLTEQEYKMIIQNRDLNRIFLL